MSGRQKREDMGQVHVMTNNQDFKEWTQLMLIMDPDTGFRHSDVAQLNIPDSCGIYELAVIDIPVYVGSTCRCLNQCQNARSNFCGLRTRINEYCRGASHKEDIILQYLEGGFPISVRVREVKDQVWGWRNKEQAARTAENELLQRYDYAWNIRSNGRARLIGLPENN